MNLSSIYQVVKLFFQKYFSQYLSMSNFKFDPTQILIFMCLSLLHNLSLPHNLSLLHC